VSSNHSITDVAFASGFGSLRQFNQVFKEIFDRTPTEIRRVASDVMPGDRTTLLLRYRKPFDFLQLLEFLRHRAIPGVEAVTQESYSRTFRTGRGCGYFHVRENPQRSALELFIDCDDIRCFMEIHNRVRRMFDLDTDFSVINDRFGQDALLSRGMRDNHVPRLPMAFDAFEFMVRAILGQQITVKAATLAGRVAASAGQKVGEDFPEGLELFFPNAKEVAAMPLAGLGLTQTRQETLKRAVRAVLDGLVSLSPNQPFESFREAFVTLKGVGDWTANYMAMRGLGMIDAFPAADLGIIKAMTRNGRRPSVGQILEQSEAWRPYRAYAALCLWNIKEN
jgi:AraC family transcriptional regulator of adaptative response / DNA-3-methyladenine glycosylase II